MVAKLDVGHRVQERRKCTDCQGSDATGPDFSEKCHFAAKPM